MRLLQLLVFVLLCSNTSLFAAKKLHFKADGNFKIVQFTDAHIGCLPDGVNATLDLFRELLDDELPDLVVFTGDIVVQNNPKEKWDLIAALLAERNLPWAVVLGNHDDEYDTKRPALTELFKSYPDCLNEKAKDVDGETNYVLSILNAEEKPAALLYAFDSHAYSRFQGVKGYDCFQLSQLNWYRNQSVLFSQLNGNKLLPALAFFHIPFPEYQEVKNSRKTPVIGKKKEEVACAKVNGGLYAQILSCGDVMGTFVGHDHVNDYIGVLNGIALAYGRFSNPTGCPYGKIKAGARVIVLKENERKFVSWIRVRGGETMDACTYPDSFLGK